MKMQQTAAHEWIKLLYPSSVETQILSRWWPEEPEYQRPYKTDIPEGVKSQNISLNRFSSTVENK